MTGKHLLSFFLLVVSLVCRAHDGKNFVAPDLLASLQSGDKTTLLIVRFGTTHDDTRALTIDTINQKAKETSKDAELRKARTFRIIMRHLKARGVGKLNPIRALEKLKTDGYTHVLTQSTNIIEGIKMESLRRNIATVKSSFREIRIGNPLLYTPEDCEAIVAAIIKSGAKEDATLLVGHGTYTPATAQYAMLDYMLKENGFRDYSVGAIEGYPTFDTMVAQIKANGTKKVLLMPSVFVVGDRAKSDIAGDWKEELEKKGYKVSMFMEGLEQNPDIQKIFIEHARFMAKHRVIDIVDKKKAYVVERN